jgi:hypothetical protein
MSYITPRGQTSDAEAGLLSYGAPGIPLLSVLLTLTSLATFVGGVLEQKSLVGTSYLHSVEILSWATVGIYAFSILTLVMHSLLTPMKGIRTFTSYVFDVLGLGALVMAGVGETIVFTFSFRSDGKVGSDMLFFYASLACYSLASGLLLLKIASS